MNTTTSSYQSASAQQGLASVSSIHDADSKTSATRTPWHMLAWRAMEMRIGLVPLPIYLLLLALIGGFVSMGKVPTDISVSIAVLAVGGFTCAEFGKRMPLLRHIGAAAIFATFVPSFLVYVHAMPPVLLKNVAEFTKNSNFLYLFIASIVVGSIFSMDREVLIKGFLKIFAPLAAGTLVAALVGTAVGTALGMSWQHTLFFIVVPIMAGGVGEGAIPLSMGYAAILGHAQGEIFAEVLPPVMLGSLSAILMSGALNFVGKRYPHLTGEGRLQPGAEDDLRVAELPAGSVDVGQITAAGLTAISLYMVGLMAHKLFEFPAPVVMLFVAVALMLCRVVSPQLQQASGVVYKFFSTAVTYPLLFAIGAALTPWDKLIAAFTIVNLITIVATVATLMATGFVVGRMLKMYPIETAIINACHSGQGGTGDVAILTAANRMQMMPFAQIATRIGGAIVVTLALFALARVGL